MLEVPIRTFRSRIAAHHRRKACPPTGDTSSDTKVHVDIHEETAGRLLTYVSARIRFLHLCWAETSEAGTSILLLAYATNLPAVLLKTVGRGPRQTWSSSTRARAHH